MGVLPVWGLDVGITSPYAKN